MKKNIPILILSGLSLIIASCTREYDPQQLRMWTFGVESSKAAGRDTANFCYMNLTDGNCYNRTDAKSWCERVDFVYSYMATPGNYRRILQTMQASGLAGDFETVTFSLIQPAGIYGATDADFDRLSKSSHVESLIKKLKIDWNNVRPFVEITNNADDTPDETIFVFITSMGKKGVFKIASYQPKRAPDDKATLTIWLKVQK